MAGTTKDMAGTTKAMAGTTKFSMVELPKLWLELLNLVWWNYSSYGWNY